MNPPSALRCTSSARVHSHSMGIPSSAPWCPSWITRWYEGRGSAHAGSQRNCWGAARGWCGPLWPTGPVQASQACYWHSPSRPTHTQHCCSPGRSGHQHSGLCSTGHTGGWRKKHVRSILYTNIISMVSGFSDGTCLVPSNHPHTRQQNF